MNAARFVVALIVFSQFLLLAGCSPIRFRVTIGPDDERLEETVVLADPRPGRHKIAMIDLSGLIADRRPPGLLAPGENPVDAFLAALKKAEEDSRVRAVLVRINSPGGTVSASDILYEELRLFSDRTGKPVVAHLGEIAASGGYYIALGADTIVAHPSGVTGSIGVIIPTINLADGLGRIGITGRSVVSGPNKNIASPIEPAQEEHYRILQSMVDEMHGRFVEKVRNRRPGLDPADLAGATDGRVFTGSRAVELGLADRTGGLREAFEEAKSRAGIERASLVKYHAEGRTLRTPYATGPAPSASDGAFFELRMGAGTGELTPGRAYFVWPQAVR